MDPTNESIGDELARFSTWGNLLRGMDPVAAAAVAFESPSDNEDFLHDGHVDDDDYPVSQSSIVDEAVQDLDKKRVNQEDWETLWSSTGTQSVTKQNKGGDRTSNKSQDAVVAAPRRSKYPKPKCGPQRPLSAYNLFFREYRLRLMQEMGGPVPFVTMGKEVGRKWKSLSDKERLKWEQKAEEESNRYLQELLAYKEDNRKKRRLAHLETPGVEKSSKPQKQKEESKTLAGMELGGGQLYTSPTSYGPNPDSTNCFNRSQSLNQGRRQGQVQQQSLPPYVVATATPRRTSLQEVVDLAAVAARTPFPRAKEVVNLPEGFSFPEGLPGQGSEVYMQDSQGALRSHTLCGKVYVLAEPDATAFMENCRRLGQGRS